jgi:hypothetical protein
VESLEDSFENYPIVRTDLHLERYPIFSTSQTFSTRDIRFGPNTIIVQPYELVIDGPELEREYRQRKRTGKKDRANELVTTSVDSFRDLVVERAGEGCRGTLNLGILTAFDLRTLYLLHAEAFDYAVRLWQQGQEKKASGSRTDALGWVLAEGSIPFSIRNICQRLKLSSGGKTQLPYLRSIQRLGGCNIQWGGLYERHDRSFIQRGEIFRILNKVAWERTMGSGPSGGTRGHFSFNPDIVKNIARRLCRPARLEVICALRSEIGLLMYNHIDRISYKRPGSTVRIELTTKELVQDLGLTGEHYDSPGRRYRQLLEAVNELRGQRYHTQYIEEIKITPSKSARDDAIISVVIQKDTRKERHLEIESEKLIESLERAQETQKDQVYRELIGSSDEYIPEITPCGSKKRQTKRVTPLVEDPSVPYAKDLVDGFVARKKGAVTSGKDIQSAQNLIEMCKGRATEFVDFVFAQKWVPDSFTGAFTSYSKHFIEKISQTSPARDKQQAPSFSEKLIAQKDDERINQAWQERAIGHYSLLSAEEKDTFDKRALEMDSLSLAAIESAHKRKFGAEIIEKLKQCARVQYYRSLFPEQGQ